jgi:hypothetical protein
LAAAVLTFGLGIGASTACSAWRTSVLLRPLPYKDRAQLVYACNDLKTRSVYDHFWSDRNYMDLRDQAHSALEDVAAINTFRGSRIFFCLIGARVVSGRDFTDSDGQPQPVGTSVLMRVLEPGVELLFRPDKNMERKPDLWPAYRLTPIAPRAALRWSLCFWRSRLGRRACRLDARQPLTLQSRCEMGRVYRYMRKPK